MFARLPLGVPLLHSGPRWVMKVHGLLLDRHVGGDERRHDGRVAVDERNRRWCSDGFEIGCDNGERVRVAFALDCRAAGRAHRKTKVVGCKVVGCMELEPQLGVSWLCLTFQSIRSCASARARPSYCVAQPKLLTSFERRHRAPPTAHGKTYCRALK